MSKSFIQAKEPACVLLPLPSRPFGKIITESVTGRTNCDAVNWHFTRQEVLQAQRALTKKISIFKIQRVCLLHASLNLNTDCFHEGY